MSEPEIPVTLLPTRQTVRVPAGARLLHALGALGGSIDLPCGGHGVCGQCRARIHRGAAAPNAAETRIFSAAELDQGWRLACQAIVVGPTELSLPRIAGPTHQILVDGGAIAVALEPCVRKVGVALPPPRRGDDEPDLLRLQRAFGPFEADLQTLREIGGLLRANEFRGRAVLLEDRLIDFEPPQSDRAVLAVAVDLGTTTLAASLLDVAAGRELALVARLNPQTRFGDDVLSRILYATQEADGLASLSSAAVGAVDEMIGQLCDQAGVARDAVYEVTLAGNTTMQQLFCGIDVDSLGQVPFAPTLAHGCNLPAADIGLHIHRGGRVYVAPVIGGFVGGDTVAGLIATDICADAGPTLLVDIGTNGEIVLWANGRLTAASTAAGPAFEGARILRGMRGSEGAIEKVAFDGVLQLGVIGGVAPVGICGSGLIDAAAELLRHGLLTPTGRLLPEEHLPATTPDDLRRRAVRHENSPAFVLATAAESGDGRRIALVQRDLRELQLATGAIRAGILILLKRAGLKPADLQSVLVAGGFGNFIRRKNAQRIGLLPHEIARDRIRYQGNTSLAGARLAALSLPARRRGEELARETAHVDLSTDADFHAAFAEAMLFPDAEP